MPARDNTNHCIYCGLNASISEENIQRLLDGHYKQASTRVQHQAVLLTIDESSRQLLDLLKWD